MDADHVSEHSIKILANFPTEKNPEIEINHPFHLIFGVPHKTVHQYGVSIQSSTKVRETFRQITHQKLWATKT